MFKVKYVIDKPGVSLKTEHLENITKLVISLDNGKKFTLIDTIPQSGIEVTKVDRDFNNRLYIQPSHSNQVDIL